MRLWFCLGLIMTMGMSVPPSSATGQPAERGLTLSSATAPLPVAETDAFNYARRRYARRFAVTIGIDRYDGKPWPPLGAAVSDARRMEGLLKDLGFERVLSLYDDRARRKDILRVLEVEVPKLAGPKDLVVIFFAGHGHTADRRGYIIPQDAGQDPVRTAISVQRMKETALRMKARHVAYLVDACFSGSLFRRGQGDGPPNTLAYWEAAGEDRLVQILTAGGPGEPVLEFDGWGAFTRVLHQGLLGRADLNRDGVVTMFELGRWVRPRVIASTKDRQHPLYGSMEGTGSILFVDERRAAPDVRQRDRQAAYRPVVEGIERELKVVYRFMARQSWAKAEKKMRDVALIKSHPDIHLLLAEIYLGWDALGNASLIQTELDRVEEYPISEEQEKQLIELRGRLARARRGPL